MISLAAYDLSPLNALFALLRPRVDNGVEITAGKIRDIFHHSVTYLSAQTATFYVTKAKIGSKVIAIRVDFTKYPLIDVSGYDELYGRLAAQMAISGYAENVPKEDRIDPHDSLSLDDLLVMPLQ